MIIFASIVALMIFSLVLYTEVLDNEEQLLDSAAKRYKSYLLADELRQSSDDLTRMVRTYAVTSDPKYKEYFDKILAIRDGEAPRPAGYHNIYWDFVAATGLPPRIDTPARSLQDLMKDENFTETEFALLREAENASSDLVNLENRAMNALEGLFEDGAGRYTKGEPDKALALNLLHGDEYHSAKEKIMQPLGMFFETIDQRTSGEIAVYRDKQRRVNSVLMTTLGLSVCLALIFPAPGLDIYEQERNRCQEVRIGATSGCRQLPFARVWRSSLTTRPAGPETCEHCFSCRRQSKRDNNGGRLIPDIFSHELLE